MNTLLNKLDDHSLRKKHEIRIHYSKGMSKLQLAVKYGVDILEIVEIVKGCKRESISKELVASQPKTELTPEEVNERIAVMQGWAYGFCPFVYLGIKTWYLLVDDINKCKHQKEMPDFYYSWEFAGPLLEAEEMKYKIKKIFLDGLYNQWVIIVMPSNRPEQRIQHFDLPAVICLAYLEIQ